MEKEEIIKAHPSICYNCNNARKPASDSNTEKGYVGCCAPLKEQNSNYNDDTDLLEVFVNKYITGAKEIAEGWVDLRSGVFSEDSGVITNYQMLTLEVKGCSKFTQRN